MIRLLIAVVLVSTTSAAWAQAPGETPSVVAAPSSQKHDDGRPTRITIEPLYLVIGMVDLTLERQVMPHVTVGATAGYGKMLFGQATIWDLGVQSNVYLRANATGWHAGAQLRYLGVALADWLKTDEEKMMGDGRARIVGGYLGYTWVSDRGLTLMTQIGVGQLQMINTTEGTKTQIAPIANFTLGWAL